MNVVTKKISSPERWLLWSIMAVASSLLISCGGDSETPAPPPPSSNNPAPTPAPTGGTVFGGPIEASSPGTPLYQLQGNSQALSTLFQRLTGNGTAQIVNQTVTDYGVNQSGQWGAMNAPSSIQSQNSQFQISADGWSNTLWLSSWNTSSSYQLYYAYNLCGKQLISTDQVGIFVGRTQNGLTEILRVGYNQANPPIQRFIIERTQGLQYSASPYPTDPSCPNQARIWQQTFTTSFGSSALQPLPGGFPQGYDFPQGNGYPQGNGSYPNDPFAAI